jgi:serine protease
MKRLISVLIVFLLTFILTGKVVTTHDLTLHAQDKKSKAEFVEDELVIGYNDGINIEEPSKRIRSKHGLEQLEVGYKGNFEVVKIPNNKKMNDLINEIKKEVDVKYAEPNYLAYSTMVPNDPKFVSDQWNFYNQGSKDSVGKAYYYGIQMEAAWDVSTGSGVKVAIIDTGVAYENYGKLKIAPDLAKTKFDTLNAKNFYARKPTSHANDDNGHGTHVCGTIAQSTNNNLGCAGIAYNATILPIKVLGAGGSGTYSAIASGINWAADHGADIINMSLGGSSNSSVLYNAIKYADSKGVLIVCASGNEGGAIIYPALYTECIAVGATDSNGSQASFSNFGSDLDIVAPGVGIMQQTFLRTNVFGFYAWNGTSMATPHVAGVAALIMSAHSTYTNSQIKTALFSTARDLGDTGFDNYYGNGLLDANAAVNWVP